MMRTQNYSLHQWSGNDYINWVEMNEDNAILDATLVTLATTDYVESLLGVLGDKADSIAGGSGVVSSYSSVLSIPKDVNFYDYDGTLLYSYTVSEVMAMASLPSLPSHAGLVCQGWNWTLSDLKALGRGMNVGAIYCTDDGKTRLYIHIPELTYADVPIYFNQSTSNGVSIDWGDDSGIETVNGAGYVSATHQYACAGAYVITLDVADECNVILGGYCNKQNIISNDYTVSLFSIDSDEDDTEASVRCCILGPDAVYMNMLQRVFIGTNVTTLDESVFHYCQSLTTITIPQSVTGISTKAFQRCSRLAYVSLPKSLSIIQSSTFRYCDALISVFIPNEITKFGSEAFANSGLLYITLSNSITSISSDMFLGCDSLTHIEIPSSITDIGNNAFAGCSGLSNIVIPAGTIEFGLEVFYGCSSIMSYHLQSTSPSYTGYLDFDGASSYVIYVPKGCLAAYQNCDEFAFYASHLQEEPE
jgi:hypothetical protein